MNQCTTIDTIESIPSQKSWGKIQQTKSECNLHTHVGETETYVTISIFLLFGLEVNLISLICFEKDECECLFLKQKHEHFAVIQLFCRLKKIYNMEDKTDT